MTQTRTKVSIAEDLLRRRAPDLTEDRVKALGAIWDEVVKRIIQAMLARDDDHKPPLHINVRAEMTYLLADMSLFFTEKVVEKRIGDRDPDDIDPEAERTACFDADGLREIEETAELAHRVVWRKRLDERWAPKSRKALDREASPPPSKPIAVKPVTDKHFISKWFIRDHWAQGQTATRWRKAGAAWTRASIPFGRWAYRQGLWSDRLEAYFALIEGEAKRPVQMLMRTIPLNPPQTQAFVAYLVIHFVRNPRLIRAMWGAAAGDLEDPASVGLSVEDMVQYVFDELFTDHELYSTFGGPLISSPWAIVRSPEPVFVLPDTFCAYGHVGEAFRVIAPLSPHMCFVTLPGTEEIKPAAPAQLKVDLDLARRISALLVHTAEAEYLSHPQFEAVAQAPPAFLDVLRAIAARAEQRT